MFTNTQKIPVQKRSGYRTSHPMQIQRSLDFERNCCLEFCKVLTRMNHYQQIRRDAAQPWCFLLGGIIVGAAAAAFEAIARLL